MYYLQKTEVILEEKEYAERFFTVFDALKAQGLEADICEADNAEEAENTGTLLITDSVSVTQKAVAAGRAVLVFLHGKNRKQSFEGVCYAFENPEDLDREYLEQVYRRHAGLPWDILDTERCHLRETTEADVEDFYRIYAEPSVTAYMEDLYSDPEQEREYTRKYIENVYGFYGFGVWTVIKKDTGEVIGRAGLSYREGFDEPELGFVIGVPWQGKGYGLEVCRAVLRYGREHLGLGTIQALVEAGNQVSLHLCKKLGMTVAGTVILQEKQYVKLIFDELFI
ncbi:MAG: GNAT family N-acetyltransferase [Lachnoclostridium sp.]|nr:GNAT family N-acetyltransferase [Lachnospira sp.]MCM1248239.1 GNAT family N-acetyltransferase [Lachnoclostridium sp.]